MGDNSLQSATLLHNMMHGVSCTGTHGQVKVGVNVRMCGCIKVDDNNVGATVGMRDRMEWVTDMGGGLSGHGEHVEMEKSKCV